MLKIFARFILFTLLTLLSSSTLSAQMNKRYIYYVSHELLIDEKYESAIDVLNMLLRSDELSPEAFFLRGVAKYNLGDYMGAESDFSKAIEINSVYTMAYHYRAITRSYLGNYEDSIEDFATAIDIRPDQESLFYSRGVTLFLSQQFKEAISDFDYFLRRRPNSVDAYVNRGTSYLMLKDTVNAFNDYDRAVKTNVYDPAGYTRRGALYLQKEEFSKAYEDLTEAIKLDSANIPAYFNRALVNSSINKPLNAVSDFDKVIELDSTSSLTYFNRALLLSQIGDYNRAMEDYDKVAQLSPKNVLVYFNRGGLNSKLGDVESAESDFTKAIELYPDFANAYMNRSFVRHTMGKMDESKRDNDIAQEKIKEYRSKMSDSTFSIYADTSKMFSSLLSFDADFGNKDFEVTNMASSEIKPLSMFRYTLSKERDQFTNHNRYVNRSVDNMTNLMNDFSVVMATLEEQLSENDSRKFVEKVDKYIDNKPDSELANFVKGAVEHSKRQYSNALSLYSKAILNNSQNPFLYMNRAVANAEMTEFVAMISNQNQKIVIDADPVNQLKSVKRTYNYDAALLDINKAIELDPNVAQFHYNKGYILTLAGDMVRAIDSYTKAIELYPRMAEAYLNRGIIQIGLKETRKGFLDISQAGELGNKRAYEIIKHYGDILR